MRFGDHHYHPQKSRQFDASIRVTQCGSHFLAKLMPSQMFFIQKQTAFLAFLGTELKINTCEFSVINWYGKNQPWMQIVWAHVWPHHNLWHVRWLVLSWSSSRASSSIYSSLTGSWLILIDRSCIRQELILSCRSHLTCRKMSLTWRDAKLLGNGFEHQMQQVNVKKDFIQSSKECR